jgi:hypothetical protein
LRNDRQPIRIFASRRKVIQMLFTDDAALFDGFDHMAIAAVVLVKEENKLSYAALPLFISHRMASSRTAGATSYSRAKSATESRALNLPTMTEVDIPVPASTGLPKDTVGLMEMYLGSLSLSATTNG